MITTVKELLLAHYTKTKVGRWFGFAAGVFAFAQPYFGIMPEKVSSIVQVVGAAVLAANGALVKAGHKDGE